MPSRPPDVAGLRHRLPNLKHTRIDSETSTSQPGKRVRMGENTAPHNPSMEMEGEGIVDTSGEMLLSDEIEEEEDDSLMNSLSSSSSNASGGGAANGNSGALNENGDVKSSGSHDNISKRDRISSSDTIENMASRFPAHRSRTHRKRKSEIVEESSSRWFGFDLSIIVALISPIGNMLTGGDHVKNILLLLLLVYYLHQLVEVPWTLYKESIPRHEPEEKEAEENPERKLNMAHAELQSYEITYLTLTVLSPFLGATLLRMVATAITGDANTLSWFSTSLYVLATGIRPWTHLVERLKSRSRALNDILRELEDEDVRNRNGDDYAEEEMTELRSYIHSLDDRLLRLSDKGNTDAKELYEHLQGVVEGMDKTLRRHRSELVKSTQAQNTRVAMLEARLNNLDMALEKSLLENERGAGIWIPAPREAWEWFLGMTWSAWIYARHVSARYGIGPYPVTARSGSGRSLKLMGPGVTGATSSPPLSRRSSRHLEPIVEEDVQATTQPGVNGANGFGASVPVEKPGEGVAAVLIKARRARRRGGLRGLVRACVSLALRVIFSPFIITVYMLNVVLSVPAYLYRVVFS